MTKPSIVFINQATGYLTIDIVNAFVRSGKFSAVALIAGSIRVQDIPLDSTVTQSKITRYNRGTPLKKFLSWFWGTVQIFMLLLFRYRKYEIFYVTVPPFAYLLSLFFRNRFSVLVFDVYPDTLKIYNISERNPMYKLWAFLNRKIFHRAHKLFTLGKGMADLLLQYTDSNRITIIPNWSGLTRVKEVSRNENIFISHQKLDGKFIVQYSGNIGYTHNVEALVELAEQLQDVHDIFFLIIGRGERYHAINQRIQEKQLMNCRLLPFQPDDQLNYTLSAADLAVVILDEKTAHVSIPSKLYNIQAVGVPVLGIGHPQSELAHHIQKHNMGRCFSSNDLSAIAGFIRSLPGNRELLAQWRMNSKDASRHYTSQNAERYVQEYVRGL